METVIHSDNDFATVAFLRIKHADLELKTEARVLEAYVPPLLDNAFTSVHDVVAHSQDSTTAMQRNQDIVLTCDAEPSIMRVTSKRLGSWVAIANAQREVTCNEQHLSVEDEVRECFKKLQGMANLSPLPVLKPIYIDALSEHTLNLSHCANINIFLSSMDLFARMNAVYATFFGTSPPARACVAVDLPSPIRFRLDCIAYAECAPSERQALHVQSLSYWAPANIGPYSQATIVCSPARYHG